MKKEQKWEQQRNDVDKQVHSSNSRNRKCIYSEYKKNGEFTKNPQKRIRDTDSKFTRLIANL